MTQSQKNSFGASLAGWLVVRLGSECPFYSERSGSEKDNPGINDSIIIMTRGTSLGLFLSFSTTPSPFTLSHPGPFFGGAMYSVSCFCCVNSGLDDGDTEHNHILDSHRHPGLL